jgi:hypothetical protein
VASAKYSWPNTVRVIILRGMQWMRHVGHMRAVRNAYKILVRKAKGRDLLGDVDIGGKIIFQRILRKCCFMLWMLRAVLRIVPVAGSCEHSNEQTFFLTGLTVVVF